LLGVCETTKGNLWSNGPANLRRVETACGGSARETACANQSSCSAHRACWARLGPSWLTICSANTSPAAFRTRPGNAEPAVRPRSAETPLAAGSSLCNTRGDLHPISAMRALREFFRSDEAIAVTEYGLLVALVAILMISVVTVFGSGIRSWFLARTSTITTV